ncbi:MAG: hypothetical protein ABIC57_03565 [bacterium]
MSRFFGTEGNTDNEYELFAEYLQREPILPFPTYALKEIAFEQLRYDKKSDSFQMLIHHDMWGMKPLDTFIGLNTFLEEVIDSYDKQELWFKESFSDELGNKDKEKLEKFTEDIVTFVKTSVVTKSLYEIFPDDKLRRSYLGGIILRYHKMIEPQYFDKPVNEEDERTKDKIEYGYIVDMFDLEIVERVKVLCERFIEGYEKHKNPRLDKVNIEGLSDMEIRVIGLRNGLIDGCRWTYDNISKEIGVKRGIARKIEKLAMEKFGKSGSIIKFPTASIISLTKEDGLLLRFLTKRFERFSLIDCAGKNPSNRIRGKNIVKG